MQTTQDLLDQLHRTLVEQYRDTIKQLPLKTTLRDALIDGYRAGVHSGIFHLTKMLDVKVVNFNKQEKAK